MTRRITLTTEIDIQFSDEEKAKAYFIDGDWKEYFFTYSDMRDLCEHIAYSFHMQGGWREAYVEGFGTFIREDEIWKVTNEDFGTIFIREEQDTEPSSCYEIDNFI